MLHRVLAELAERLEAWQAVRAVIDYAKGIIMAQNRCTADEAFLFASIGTSSWGSSLNGW